MIQFNLLPNVKLEFVRAKRLKRLTIVVASLVAGATLTIFVILFVVVQVLQKKYSTDLTQDIKAESSTLVGTQDLNKILTIQNQLNSLTALHEQKPVATRLFDYLKQVTPAKVSIASLNIDFDTQTVNITGSADSISTVNVFADTLKFTTFKTNKDVTGNAFSSVVLTGFGRDLKGASYQMSFKFEPTIFSGVSEVSITVPPNKITTRSETEKPEDLFQPLSKPNPEKQ